MKSTISHIVVTLFIVLLFTILNLSCSDDEPTKTKTPEDAPLLGTNWKLHSIEYSYSDSLVDPLGWKAYIINSGIVTTIGNVTLELSDSSFIFVVELDNFYSIFWGTNDLFGISSGSFLISSNLLTLKSESTLGIFNFGKSGQEAYANYNINADTLSIFVTMPVYLKTFDPPYFSREGDEFYDCKFINED